ncbi:hypothetical protein IC619_016575, partial [Hazenella sp. IB182353]|uniref:hypothetical protein n=1 Tax=Polycladospora coralii TaxID=2771432 RepID=UPI001BCECE99
MKSVEAGEQVVESYQYDLYDNIAKHQKQNKDKTGMLTTQFTYDGLDRTTSKVEHVGTEQEQTTTFDYLATSGEMISESVDGKKTNSYVYTASGNLFSMV